MSDHTLELLETLKTITHHFAGVMGGPLVTSQGVVFENGVEGIPTIKAAREMIARVEGDLSS